MTRVCLRPLVSAANVPRIYVGRGESRTLGRSATADVHIDEPSLSRLHARISVNYDGVAVVEDMGSTNGVFINGNQRLSGSLASGDVVRFGTLDYLVEKESPSDKTVSSDQTIVRVAVAADATKNVDRTALEGLLATSRELMAFSDLAGLLERVLDRVHAILTPDRSAILFVDSSGQLTPRAVRPSHAYTSISEFASATVVREALAAREVLVVHDARLDSRLQQAGSVALAGIRSVMCVPLFGRSGPIGAVYADRLHKTQGFTPELVHYAAAFASHAAAALETAQLYEDRQRHFRATLEAFAKAIDARDHHTAGHSQRVADYAALLARVIGLPLAEIEVLRHACMLHDIGKVGVPDSILRKGGSLDAQERSIMQSHVTIGGGMLDGLPFLKDALPGIIAHHERWDGLGYPNRLSASDVHVHARLMAVADSYDAMTSRRPYRDALSDDEAARRLHADKGCQFDPAAVDAFDAATNEFVALSERNDTRK